MVASDQEIKQRIRNVMESGAGGGRLFSLAQEAKPYLETARYLLDAGLVGAVDGTNALAKIDFMNMTTYACAFGYVTSQARSNPNISITETASAYLEPEEIRESSDESLAALADRLDESRESDSWTTTFREYEERRLAIDHCPADYVLIDGPIFTQNLVTQELGRRLYQHMFASPKKYIGVIKDVSGSWAMCRWSAYSLKPGEGYIICPVGQPIGDRYSRGPKSDSSLSNWLKSPALDNYIRAVYRPNEKAFAFECLRSEVGIVCALLLADASPTIHHELPLLLETIDSQLRAGFDAGQAKELVINRIMAHSQGGYQSAIDATSEREFR